MIVGDILVMWRASAIWFDRKVVMLLPLFWWGLLVGICASPSLSPGGPYLVCLVDTIVQGAFCQSGVSSTDYTRLCKVTNVSGPILSILTNLSVMVLVAWKIWYELILAIVPMIVTVSFTSGCFEISSKLSGVNERTTSSSPSSFCL